MDYSNMTVSELQTFLREKGTPFKSNDRKRKLIEYATEAEENEKVSKSVRKSPSKTVRKSPSKTVRKSPSKTVRKSPSKTVRKSPSKTEDIKRKDEIKMSPFSQKWENKVKKNKIIKTITDDSGGVYDLRKEIGDGTYGTVYFGTSRNTGAHYAFKEIFKEGLDGDILVSLKNESKIHKELTGNENILKFYKSFENEKVIYIITELVEGDIDIEIEGDDQEKINICKVWMRQLLEGVKHIHYKGYIHLDLKPENVLMYRKTPDLIDTKLKIADFGLSIPIKDKERPLRGTLLYIAPEVLEGRNYDHNVDVWSLGCIFYFLIYGRDAFEYDEENDREYLNELIEDNENIDEEDLKSEIVKDKIKGNYEFIEHWEDRYEEANKVIRKMIANKNKRLDIPELLELSFFNI